MPRLTDIKPLPNHRLWIRYDDATEGEVDLSEFAGRGVFAAWSAPGAFESVIVGSGGEARWDAGVDLCPDMLYLRLTGRRAEDLFPNIAGAGVDA